MKFIDEKGRIFGKINIIDICVLLAIVLAVGGYFLKSASLGKSETVYKNVTYTLEIKSVRNATIDSLNESIGKEVFVPKTNELLGTVAEVTYTDAKDFLVDKNGKYVESTQPDKYDVKVTITTRGTENRKGVYTEGGKQLFIGEGVIMSTNNLETSGEVMSIDVKEE